jgi:G patch domain-containing protein 1
MDEEDRADAAEAQKLQMTQAFAGLASANQQSSNAAGLMDLFRPTEDTIGLKLLRKMGWKDGQGIGPKVRRDARLDVAGPKAQQGQQTYLFAPEKMQMIHFNKKNDRKGLGYKGEAQLSRPDQGDERNDDDEDDDDGGLHFNRRSKPSIISSQRSRTKPERGGIGVGILNDNGSDEEDPYEIGPKIRYNRVIGADKKKKTKKSSASANPSLGNAPVFVPKIARAGGGLGRCHDGRLPLDGFSLAKVTEDLASLLLQYAPPTVPPGWTSSKNPGATDSNGQEYVSTADAARASKMDPKSRAAILGEKALPGKSIFDFISSSARDKIATASGKNLPPGLGEIPKEYALSEEEKYKMLWDQVSKIDRETAVAAIARGSAGPYADDESKRDRYRGYLEHQANPERPHPTKARHMSDDDFLREMNEFYNCARIFKPMTGFMASRFTTGKSSTSSTIRSSTVDTELLAKPEPKAEDPAEQAAKMGMFGSMTRSVTDFYPTRLLCKRFNVKPPPNARGDKEPNAASAAAAGGSTDNTEAWSRTMPSDPQTSTSTSSGAEKSSAPLALPSHLAQQTPAALEDKVELGRNEAVEGKTAQADVLKAIFGDSDSDDK